MNRYFKRFQLFFESGIDIKWFNIRSVTYIYVCAFVCSTQANSEILKYFIAFNVSIYHSLLTRWHQIDTHIIIDMTMKRQLTAYKKRYSIFFVVPIINRQLDTNVNCQSKQGSRREVRFKSIPPIWKPYPYNV